MKRLYVLSAAACLVAACGENVSTETETETEIPVTALADSMEDVADEEAAPDPAAPLSAEQQAATNARINMAALKAYRDYAEQFKADTGAYPLTKRSFRSAIGAFEDAAEAELNDGSRINLDLPIGAKLTQPGAIVYRSNGTDYKLIAQRTGDCSVVKKTRPKLIDPKREYGPGDCVAYGYWTNGAETW